MSQDPFGARLLSEITCRLQAAGIGEARLEAQLLAAQWLRRRFTSYRVARLTLTIFCLWNLVGDGVH